MLRWIERAGKYWPYVRERTNEQWLAELRGPNPGEALADLYDLLVRGLRAALGGYGGDVEANFGDFAQEALIKITGNLDSFRGESRFTTWAQKIAMNVALTELKRRRWRDVSLQDLFARREGADRGPADPHLTSEQLALQNTVLRGRADRSWSASRPPLPTVAHPTLSDQPPHCDHHHRERHPEIDDPPHPLGAPHQLLVGVVPRGCPLHHPPPRGPERRRPALPRD